MRNVLALASALMLVSCNPDKGVTPTPAESHPCNRYQIVSGSVSIPGYPDQRVSTMLRIDTETGHTWYWLPESPTSKESWLPAADPLLNQ